MNLIPKVMLLIHQHHVIKIFILSLLISACTSSDKNVDSRDSYEIINIQIGRNLVHFEGESSLLSFDLNDYLGDYLKKIENDNFSSEVLKDRIGLLNFNKIFSTSEITYLKNTKNQVDIDILNLNTHDIEFKLDDVKKDNQLLDAEFMINLSYPKFTSNNNYGLIAFAFGFTGSMDGGVNLYEKKKGKWRFLKTIDYWIE